MKSFSGLLKEFTNEKFDIIVLAGQSNAQGHGMGAVKEPFAPSEKICYLQDNANIHFEKDENGVDYLFLPDECEKSIVVAQEAGECDKPDGRKVGNLSLIFAKHYVANGLLQEGRKLLIIHTAVGGTGFAKKQWGVGNVLYERLVDMTQCALDLNPENRIVAILWHQGEHDEFENADMTREEGEAAGAKIARELMKKLAPVVDGYYFMLPFNRVSLMERIFGEEDKDLF